MTNARYTLPALATKHIDAANKHISIARKIMIDDVMEWIAAKDLQDRLARKMEDLSKDHAVNPGERA